MTFENVCELWISSNYVVYLKKYFYALANNYNYNINLT